MVGDGGPPFVIRLDDRPVKTPARAPLALPSRALAAAVAAEWAAQGDRIMPAAMPLTGLANAAIDHVLPDPLAFAAPLAAYAAADLLCYRDGRDAVLAARQAAAWNPWLDWAEAEFGVEFRLAAGVMPVDQPPATTARLTAAVQALDGWRLAALAPLVTIGGSLVAALAVLRGAARADALWPVVALDALYQEERWGADAEATAQHAAHQRDWDHAARFAGLLDQPGGGAGTAENWGRMTG